MKTILVPTDFSETAANAINYAAELAKQTKAKLLLFHAYHVPVIVSEVPLELTGEDFQLEEKNNVRLKLIAENVQKKYEHNFSVDYISQPGFASDEITELAKDKNCDLIVMGTKGATGINKFWGSNTVEVIKHTENHVLVIPDKIKFQKIDKIVFAFDYDIIEDQSVFDPLLEIASIFNSEILIFNMKDGRVHPDLNKGIAGVKLNHIFENVKHTYWFSEWENIVDAINGFADENNAVMITMIRKKHNLFHQMFNKSSTKSMALHSHLPLLILHELTD